MHLFCFHSDVTWFKNVVVNAAVYCVCINFTTRLFIKIWISIHNIVSKSIQSLWCSPQKVRSNLLSSRHVHTFPSFSINFAQWINWIAMWTWKRDLSGAHLRFKYLLKGEHPFTRFTKCTIISLIKCGLSGWSIIVRPSPLAVAVGTREYRWLPSVHVTPNKDKISFL